MTKIGFSDAVAPDPNRQDKQPLDLSDFSPRSRPQTQQEREVREDMAGERAGFVSREATTEPLKMRVGAKRGREVMDQINIRCTLKTTNAFRAYCNANDLSAGELLTHLMVQAGLLKD